MSRTALLLSFAWLLWLPAPLAAQDSSPPVFGEVVEVRIVNLEAVVEDRKGNRVTGLPPDAFRLRIDGEETPIDFFTEVAGGQAADPTATSLGAIGARVTPGTVVGTSYLVFVDEYFSIRRDRNRVLESISGEVSRLGREDRMAIVAYDGRRLDMISNWNQSPAELQQAIQGAMERPSRGLMTRNLLRELQVEELESRIENMVVAVTSTLRSFGNPPGRKVMLLMSGGWPHSPERWVLDREFVFDMGRGDRTLEPIYQTANLLGYTLYPIDVPGIQRQGAAASSRGRERRSDVQETEVHQTLRILAQATGGEPLLNNARLASLDTVIEDTRSYYWLGFTPRWQGDNQGHEVKLEVLRPGLKVRHRRGYEDMSRQKEVNFIVEGALLFGQLPGRAEFKAEVGTPRRDGRRLLVPLHLLVPLDEITVIPYEDRYVARLELRVAALDQRGNRSELAVIPITLQSASPATPGQTVVQQVTARVRKKKQDLIVSLHDPVSGTTLVSVLPFEP